MDSDDAINFPELAQAARRLGLDESELIEAMISALDSGLGYWAALHLVVAEAAQRRGLYDHEIKAQIDSGRVFLATEGTKPPTTPGRLIEALEFEYVDFLDALATVGAHMDASRQSAVESEFQQRRAARLAAVKTNGRK